MNKFPNGHENLEEEMVIYVAVGKDVKECLSMLLWALHNCGGKRICIIHVHRPAKRIPFRCKCQNIYVCASIHTI